MTKAGKRTKRTTRKHKRVLKRRAHSSTNRRRAKSRRKGK